MYVNNEIGSSGADRRDRERCIKEKNPKALCSMWMQSRPMESTVSIRKSMDIDLLSVSGHKIHGPKESGFLYVIETE
ncbi:MAG: hypothetical protein ACLSHV_04985 [Hominisplanchenecus sp.]